MPTQISLLQVLTLESMYVALRPNKDTIQAIAAATATVKLGPATAVVERFELSANLSFPTNGGNLEIHVSHSAIRV